MTELHPASELFPLMDTDALLAFAEDIRTHGLIEPILTCEGKVLDGRNRLRACELVGVEPRFEEWDANGSSPAEFVISKNLHRRHLTVAQKTALALDLLPHLEAEAKERQVSALRQGDRLPVGPILDQRGRSNAKAAALVGVGPSTVAAAKAIQKRDPEIIDRMRTGEVPTVAAAARQAGFKAMSQGGGTVGSQKTVRDAEGKEQPAVHYGKGDKFSEATEPLRRYLAAWHGRGFEFRHVNPKDAAKRLRVIDDLLSGLTSARGDLSTRATPARMRV